MCATCEKPVKVGSIKGKVTDANSKTGIENVKVEIVDGNQMVLTTVSGEYELKDLTPATYTIKFSKDNYEPRTETGLKVETDKTLPYNVELTPYALQLEMILVEGGTFTMGSPISEPNRDSDEIQHSVTLSSFYMGKYEVTQKLWYDIMGTKPSYFANCDNCPVETVSWDDIQTFLTALNTKYPGNNFRLPTDAEWEYAARGGKYYTDYFLYSGSNNIDEVAWYYNNSETHPVGQKKANQLGLYDMSGNVDEWCSDWYGSYTSSAQIDPTGSASGSYRVNRGGDWYYGAGSCRVANRNNDGPASRRNYVGFRVVRPAGSGTTTAPDAPVLVQPANGSSISGVSVTLKWTLQTGVVYDLYLDEVNGSKPVAINLTQAECEIIQLQDQKTYYWKVVAKLAETGKTTASAVWSFTVNNTQIVPTGLEMVLVEGGTFTMGSPTTELDRYSDETQHSVTLSSFYIGKYEVTQKLWFDIMGTKPSYFANCDDCPVEQVSWNDIQTFLTALNTKYPGNNFRLPTEAQWEYAARAGTTTPFSTGNCLSTAQANYNGNYPYQTCSKGTYLNKTVAVGSYAPNAWGLYDMHGNVFEWCSDWYGTYNTGAQTNPTGATSGTTRVLRGGSWSGYAPYCRVAFRNSYNGPAYRYGGVGFRVVSGF